MIRYVLLFLLLTYARLGKAGDYFYLKESRSKPVLIAVHNTAEQTGWPADNWDGKNYCSYTSQSYTPTVPGTVSFPKYTTHHSDECSDVRVHNRNPDSLFTAEQYREANQFFQEQINLLWDYNTSRQFIPPDSLGELITLDTTLTDSPWSLYKNLKAKKRVPVITFSIYEYVITWNLKPDIHTAQMVTEMDYYYGDYRYRVIVQGFPGKMEIVSGILMLKALLEKAEVTERMSSYTFEVLNSFRGGLEDKTLLIDQNYLDTTLTVAKMKEEYPYKFNIVPKEIIENAVVNRTPGLAYILSYPMLSSGYAAGVGKKDKLIRTYMLLVIDAETGKTLSSGYDAAGKSSEGDGIPLAEGDLRQIVRRSK